VIMAGRTGIFILLLLVFAIRASVPVGFMPDVSGGEWVTICSGVESKTIHVGNDGQPIEDSDSSEQACPFSFLAAAMHSIDVPFVDIVWFRVEFPESIVLTYDVRVHDIYFAEDFIQRQAPPSFS